MFDIHFYTRIVPTGEYVDIKYSFLCPVCTRLTAAGDQSYQLLTHVGGSLRVLWLLPPLKLVAMI
jgi:hypothetical protein